MTFSVVSGGETRSATVVPVEYGGSAYVSLTQVLSQLGGACRVRQGRVYVDYAGTTAWIELGGTGVSAASSQFSLDRLVTDYQGEALMARTDVVPFLSKAFRVTVRQSAALGTVTGTPQREPAPTPAPPPAGAAIQEPDAEEPLLLPEPVVPTPSAPQGVGTIVIDAGHGGADTGARGPGGLEEKEVALRLAMALQAELARSGVFRVVLTRSRDADLSSQARAAAVVQNRGDLLISLHTGSTSGADGPGCTVYATAPPPTPAAGERLPGARRARERILVAHAGRELAQRIAAALTDEALGPPVSIGEVPLRLANAVPVPGVLVEAGRLYGEEDEARLRDDAYLNKVAGAIAAGVGRYAMGVTPAP